MATKIVFSIVIPELCRSILETFQLNSCTKMALKKTASIQHWFLALLHTREVLDPKELDSSI